MGCKGHTFTEMSERTRYAVSMFAFPHSYKQWFYCNVRHHKIIIIIVIIIIIIIPEVMKTGSANLNFLCNFSQLPLSNISLFTVLFTAYAGFFRFFLACFLVRDMFSSGCRINYPPPPRPTRPVPPLCFLLGGGGILNGKRL